MSPDMVDPHASKFDGNRSLGSKFTSRIVVVTDGVDNTK